VAEVREDLGVFESGFASWSRILSISANDEVRLQNFRNAALEAVYYVGKGLNKSLAADELFDLAHSHGLADMVGEDVIQQIIADAFEPPQPNGNGAAHAYTEAEPPPQQEPPKAPPVKHATLYVAPDPASIPMRKWLLGGHYIRQAATATVAPGGFGKTTLTLYEAITMAADGLKVWYLSGEDPRVEIDRRIAAHCQHHGIDLAALPGQLFVDDRQSFNLSIGTSTRPGVVKFNDQSLKMFEAAIGVDELDVVMLDPFISFHGVPENDNNSIDAIIKCLGNVAHRTNTCIEISHHVRKPGQGQFGSLTIDDARGGGAIINAVRSGRVINRMNKEEAEQAKVSEDDRHFYIRVDRGKRNMAPPDKANWMRLISVHLPNGDNVQALEAWEFPALFDGVTVEDTEWVRELVRRQAYRCDSRSQQWLGVEVAQRLSLDANEKADCMRINKIIGVWLANGVFKKMEMRDPDSRQKRMYYVGVDAWEEKAPVIQLFTGEEDNND
jgi:hypothetical protein